MSLISDLAIGRKSEGIYLPRDVVQATRPLSPRKKMTAWIIKNSNASSVRTLPSPCSMCNTFTFAALLMLPPPQSRLFRKPLVAVGNLVRIRQPSKVMCGQSRAKVNRPPAQGQGAELIG